MFNRPRLSSDHKEIADAVVSGLVNHFYDPPEHAIYTYLEAMVAHLSKLGDLYADSFRDYVLSEVNRRKHNPQDESI